MWLVVSGKDLDCVETVGPFNTEVEAKQFLVQSLGSSGRVIPLKAPQQVTFFGRRNHALQLSDLVRQYGSIEAVPAPNAVVYEEALEKLRVAEKHRDESVASSLEFCDSHLVKVLSKLNPSIGKEFSFENAERDKVEIDAEVQRWSALVRKHTVRLSVRPASLLAS